MGHAENAAAHLTLADLQSWTGAKLANLSGGRLAPEGALRFLRPAELSASVAGDIAFLFSKKYAPDLERGRPSALLVSEPFVGPLQARWPGWTSVPVLVAQDPYWAMARVTELFAPLLVPDDCTWNDELLAFYRGNERLAAFLGGTQRRQGESVAKNSDSAPDHREESVVIHPTAVVAPTARLGGRVTIGPHAVIEDEATIGEGTQIRSGAWVGRGASVGTGCLIFSGVRIYSRTVIGDRCRIHANSVLGADGFGYAPKREGGKTVGQQKIYHYGTVQVGSDVEIGALSCIDRGTFGKTVVGSQAKIDNQVHIGHNASVGSGAILCGGICLAGNSRVGDFAVIGGMVGITNEVTVGAYAEVGAMSLLTKDVEPQTQVIGNPQRLYREHFKVHAALNKFVKGKRGSSLRAEVTKNSKEDGV